jgi:hypothetical protein
MSAEATIKALGDYCEKNSGNFYTWTGKNGTYTWNRGKTAGDGTVNGVVRKLAGTDASGTEIWVVAGSIKISSTGEILRFTGLAKKEQKAIQQVITPILMPETVEA